VSVGDRFLDHLAAAIRIPTVSHDDPATVDPATFDHLRGYLEHSFPATFARLEVEAFATHGLLLTWRGSDPEAPALVLMAHQDVVPVEDTSTWSRHPFGADRTDTHLIRRCAIDDKGSLIAILEAVEALLDLGVGLRRTLILALGHDEERMGADGAGAMASALARRGLRAELVLDEGGFITERVIPATRRPVALVGVSEKGYLDVELSLSATPGHSSAPPRVTAVGAVAAAVAALQSHPLPAHIERQAAFFAAAATAARPPLRQLIAALPRLGRLAERLLARRPSTDALIRTTTAPTLIEGGIKANVLPSSARALVNFRILPGDTTGSVLDHVRSVVGNAVTVTPLPGWDATPVSDVNSAGYRALEDTIAEVFPDVVVAPWIVIGATDARYFSAVSDTVLRFLPFRMNEAELTGFHGDDERIRLADAEPAVRFYRRLIERMCL
jgi:carboxypeptidase PM20D1